MDPFTFIVDKVRRDENYLGRYQQSCSTDRWQHGYVVYEVMIEAECSLLSTENISVSRRLVDGKYVLFFHRGEESMLNAMAREFL